jgi:hypothetical protein
MSKSEMRLRTFVYFSTLFLVFVLVSFSTFHAVALFKGLEFETKNSNAEITRKLTDSSTTSSSCSLEDGAVLIGGGAALGICALAGAFAFVGLTAAGPVAGGIFAVNMGPALAAGSVMSVAQSAAATGVGYGVMAGVGAVGGALRACA